MHSFKEIEFKYNADQIKRESFDDFIRDNCAITKEKELFAYCDTGKDSVDHYFSNKSNPEDPRFMRWREGQDIKGTKTWELTSKVKLNGSNLVRDEVNFSLSSADMSLEKAALFSSHHGCKYDFSIKSNVQIYWTEKVVFSHYTVFDTKGNELNRFIEIEANEAFGWASVEEAISEISVWEKKMNHLGISEQKRMKKSLFELYSGNLNKESQ